MADIEPNRTLILALKKKPTVLNLSNKKLVYLPDTIGEITSVRSLDLKNNFLCDLPIELSLLLEVILLLLF